MRIFVTGPTGFIGSLVVSDLLEAGHEVTGLVRSPGSAEALVSAGGQAVPGDLRELQGLDREARRADAVIHTAFDHDFTKLAESCEVDRLAIEAMGAALEGSGKPFIVTSGLPVVPGRIATEEDVPPPGGIPRVSEQTALSTIGRDVRVMVVRMPQVHDRTKQGFATYLLAQAREKGVSAYVGDGLNRWPAVHRFDAARLYRLVLERGAAGQRSHAVEEQGVSVREVAETIGRGLGVPVVSVAAEASPDHFGWLDRIVRMDVPVSSEVTREALGWWPRETSALLSDLAVAAGSGRI